MNEVKIRRKLKHLLTSLLMKPMVNDQYSSNLHIRDSRSCTSPIKKVLSCQFLIRFMQKQIDFWPSTSIELLKFDSVFLLLLFKNLHKLILYSKEPVCQVSKALKIQRFATKK